MDPEVARLVHTHGVQERCTREQVCGHTLRSALGQVRSFGDGKIRLMDPVNDSAWGTTWRFRADPSGTQRLFCASGAASLKPHTNVEHLFYTFANRFQQAVNNHRLNPVRYHGKHEYSPYEILPAEIESRIGYFPHTSPRVRNAHRTLCKRMRLSMHYALTEAPVMVFGDGWLQEWIPLIERIEAAYGDDGEAWLATLPPNLATHWRRNPSVAELVDIVSSPHPSHLSVIAYMGSLHLHDCWNEIHQRFPADATAWFNDLLTHLGHGFVVESNLVMQDWGNAAGYPNDQLRLPPRFGNGLTVCESLVIRDIDTVQEVYLGDEFGYAMYVNDSLNIMNCRNLRRLTIGPGLRQGSYGAVNILRLYQLQQLSGLIDSRVHTFQVRYTPALTTIDDKLGAGSRIVDLRLLCNAPLPASLSTAIRYPPTTPAQTELLWIPGGEIIVQRSSHELGAQLGDDNVLIGRVWYRESASHDLFTLWARIANAPLGTHNYETMVRDGMRTRGLLSPDAVVYVAWAADGEWYRARITNTHVSAANGHHYITVRYIDSGVSERIDVTEEMYRINVTEEMYRTGRR